MSERRIGEIVGPLVARAGRLARLQELIAKYPHASDRKKLVTMAYEIGAIRADDAKDLIAIYQLETA